MRLYHGSNIAFRDVDLSVCRPNKDFGQGFHTPSAVSALKFVGLMMSIKQKQLMEYATQDLVAMVAERQSLSIQDAMGVVYHSRLHEKLHDVETGLYLEGSEYLYGLLVEEQTVSNANL